MTASKSTHLDRGPVGRRAASASQAPDVPGFLISERLGSGGQATVWAGTRLSDGLDVALKVITAGAANVTTARQEAELLGQFSFEHLVTLHEVLTVGDDLVLVLELLRGGSLAAVVAARGHLSDGECVTVLTPLLGVLGRLHRAGVVHGDVSPGNVLFDTAGCPFLGDLGTARVAGRAVVDVSGTKGFLAPEVLLGSQPTPASDVYAVGALGRLCLTGEGPGMALDRPAQRPSVSTDGSVLQLCEQAMASEPGDRPDPDALAVALHGAATAEPLEIVSGADPTAGLTRRIREIAAAVPEPRAGRRRLVPWRERLASVVSWSRGRRWLIAAVSAAVAVACLIALVPSLLAAYGKESSPEPDTGGRVTTPVPTDSSSEAVSDSEASSGLPAQGAALDPADAVSHLAQVRARLWADPRTGDLATLDVPGSAAWQADDADRGRRAAEGIHLDGLSFSVVTATETVRDGDRATVQVSVRTSAHVETSPGGKRAVPERVGAPVLLDLVRTEAGWRVEAVRPVS